MKVALIGSARAEVCKSRFAFVPGTHLDCGDFSLTSACAFYDTGALTAAHEEDAWSVELRCSFFIPLSSTCYIIGSGSLLAFCEADLYT